MRSTLFAALTPLYALSCLPSAAPPDPIDEGSDDVADPIGELALGACDFAAWPSAMPNPPSDLECGTLEVQRVLGDPDAGTTTIFVARQRSRAFPTGRAVFQLAGGPGGSAVTQSGLVPQLLGGLRDDLDLVYVDQRGTGFSGYLDCPDGDFPQDRAGNEACLRALGDVRGLGSVEAAHDVDRVRRALGYPTIALRGGSYGTRVGLEVLRQHGAVVEAAVLDGVDPPDADFFGWTLGKADVGIELLIDDCAADPACVAVSPDLRADLEARRAALAEEPRRITAGGAPDVEDDALFVLALSYLVEDSYWRSDVPRAVHAAVSGDNDGWNALLGDLFGVTISDRADLNASYVAPGLYLYVTCTESLPNAGGLDALRDLADGLSWGDGHLLEIAEACAALDAPPLDAALRAPVVSDVPTLLLSGAADIQTPPEMAEHALETLANARHVVLPHATHSVMITPCGAELIEQFLLGDHDPAVLELGCVDEVPTPQW
ncbi:MAG: alpha/beta fold hydrolase [Deltaproteobacteria bacterium]|nr:alpha/beta fold hydrolase [Deltaproteobacteria bacterium]